MRAWERLRIWGRQRRYIVRRDPRLNLTYRIGVGVLGAIVLAGGIVAIPYPGPGWLIVFLGLGILASEFEWAHRLLRFARGRYDAWMEWMKRRHWSVQGMFGLATCVVVLASLWVLGVFGTVAGWFDVHADWAQSPIL
ncbi:putative transmembrane protein [Gordonia polyisoprenivorans VH2]|uniref:Putative transmembrane protein n=1 Tax=Gordonia polyisoprenivorans (strain DSM 44266 / VH2) TaxID=1112204 RepID=H6MZX1_GORPV|nr:TIGR02611 family protein [Gordonia polyisoprenivorans]AFA73222.1 putative transmembrane protein [Gordonia polyisoprenivorans VH2]UZF58669.1 TIGR02611 family protein [Gordonia polyisoprenivorans]WCB39798.1 TIGR02611 family protein [Gordonia polyisoprenivorans]